ncbi:hypothetical protein [Flaviflexus equikiangi]|uniref:DUF35 domain-containing protein n=1 Tax=Flaviflexus equikiangi TaxID=2758573 RepID=A0ABS2TDV3_9ACTO|nr:hypothetical protein [Flaviflexus equikiangi]MBM9432826.1 hypothetical protein [Flaviflexus equikiangi]
MNHDEPLTHLTVMKQDSASAFSLRPTPPYEIVGRMFEPGETVGVAVLLRSTEADQYGEVQATVTAADLPPRWEAVALIGYDTGTLNYIDPR